jgi:hypothetical protein
VQLIPEQHEEAVVFRSAKRFELMLVALAVSILVLSIVLQFTGSR